MSYGGHLLTPRVQVPPFRMFFLTIKTLSENGIWGLAGHPIRLVGNRGCTQNHRENTSQTVSVSKLCQNVTVPHDPIYIYIYCVQVMEHMKKHAKSNCWCWGTYLHVILGIS